MPPRLSVVELFMKCAQPSFLSCTIRWFAANYDYYLSAVYALLEPMLRLFQQHFRTFDTLGTGGKWTLSEVIVQALKCFRK